jgi:hypothetical protein
MPDNIPKKNLKMLCRQEYKMKLKILKYTLETPLSLKNLSNILFLKMANKSYQNNDNSETSNFSTDECKLA